MFQGPPVNLSPAFSAGNKLAQGPAFNKEPGRRTIVGAKHAWELPWGVPIALAHLSSQAACDLVLPESAWSLHCVSSYQTKGAIDAQHRQHRR